MTEDDIEDVSKMSEENAQREILKYLNELAEIQRELIEIYSDCLEINSSIWNMYHARLELENAQNEYFELSEDIKLAIESSFSVGVFEKSDRFDGDLDDQMVMMLSVNKFHKPIETHTKRIERLSGTIEQVISNKNQQINNQFALLISTFAIIVSAASIIL